MTVPPSGRFLDLRGLFGGHPQTRTESAGQKVSAILRKCSFTQLYQSFQAHLWHSDRLSLPKQEQAPARSSEAMEPSRTARKRSISVLDWVRTAFLLQIDAWIVWQREWLLFDTLWWPFLPHLGGSEHRPTSTHCLVCSALLLRLVGDFLHRRLHFSMLWCAAPILLIC